MKEIWFDYQELYTWFLQDKPQYNAYGTPTAGVMLDESLIQEYTETEKAHEAARAKIQKVLGNALRQ